MGLCKRCVSTLGVRLGEKCDRCGYIGGEEQMDENKTEKRLGYTTYESAEEEYTDEKGYICNSIDMYPVTHKQQAQLQKLFELLEIDVSPKLFGHTKIFIATKEVDISSLEGINR